MLDHLQPSALSTEYRGIIDVNIVERNPTMIGGHIEGPKHFLNLETLGIRRRQKRRNTIAITRLAAGSCENHIVLGFVNTGVPSFAACDPPTIAVSNRFRLHVGGIRAVIRLSNTKSKPSFARQQQRNPFFLLRFCAVSQHQQKAHVICHD